MFFVVRTSVGVLLRLCIAHTVILHTYYILFYSIVFYSLSLFVFAGCRSSICGSSAADRADPEGSTGAELTADTVGTGECCTVHTEFSVFSTQIYHRGWKLAYFIPGCSVFHLL